MTSDDAWMALPAKSVVAAWLRSLPSIVGLIAAGAVYGLRPELWPGRWAWVLIGCLLLLRLAFPIVTWATLRFDLTEDRLSVKTGAVITRMRTTDVKNITVLDVEEPWAYRVLGLSLVALHAGGEGDTTLTLAGIDRGTVAALTRQAELTRPAEAGREGAASTPMYRATAAELLIASASYGRFFILGAGAAVAAADALDQFGLWAPALAMAGAAPAFWAAAAAVALVLTGLAASLIRYHGFLVRREGERLIIAYGLVSRRERVLDAAAIVGGRIQRNLVEMVFDRARVSLHSTDTSRQITANLVLPSLPRAIVLRIVAESLPELAHGAIVTSPGSASILRSLSIVIAVIAAAGTGVGVSVVTRALPLCVAVLFGAAFALVLFGAVRLTVGRLELHGDRLIRSCRSALDREDVVRVDALHVVSTLSLVGCTTMLVRAHFFAGVPRTLTAFAAGAAIAGRTAAEMARLSAPVAAGSGVSQEVFHDRGRTPL